MKEFPSNLDMENNVLMQIQEGTKVYDCEQVEIGLVDDVFLGSTDSGAISVNESNYMQTFMFGGSIGIGDVEPVHTSSSDSYPAAKYPLVRDRMMRDGFVYINTGMFTRNRVALPEQIEKVEERRVILKVSKDELLKEDILGGLR